MTNYEIRKEMLEAAMQQFFKAVQTAEAAGWTPETTAQVDFIGEEIKCMERAHSELNRQEQEQEWGYCHTQ